MKIYICALFIGRGEKEKHNMLHIIERTQKIKGLKEPKNLVGLSDMHLTYIDDREDAWTHEMQLGRSHMFPNGDRCFREIREYIKKTQPDIVVSAGDMIDFPSHKNIEMIDDFFNNDCKEYMYVFGNHDWNSHRFYNDVHHWLENVPRLFPVLKNNNPKLQVVDLGGVLVVGVDTSTDRIYDDTLAQFKEVAALGKPMILVMHIPFYTEKTGDRLLVTNNLGYPLCLDIPEKYHSKAGDEPWLIANEATKEFVKMVHDPNVNVVASIFGHVHFEFDEPDFLFEDEYMPGRTQYGLRLSSPQLNAEGVVFLLHLVPDNE